MQWAIGIKLSGALIGEVLFLYGYGWVGCGIRLVELVKLVMSNGY